MIIRGTGPQLPKYSTIILFVVSTMLPSVATPVAANEQEGGTSLSMKIGWGQCNITPDRPVMLSGQFHRRIATSIKDPVTATVLALESGDVRVLLISCDLVVINPQTLTEIRSAIVNRLPDIPSQSIIVNATHTHTAPVTRDGKYQQPEDPAVISPAEYRAFLAERLGVAASEAWNTRKPGGISRAFARAVVGHNRRASFLDGTGKMYADISAEDFDCIEGFEDHSLNILCTWDEGNALTGLVLNLPCPAQRTENLNEVSADFWHEAREELRKNLGQNLSILAQVSPAGDQSPHIQVHKKQAEEMYQRLGRTAREEIGLRISSAVVDALPAARAAIQKDPILRHISETAPIPRRRVTDEEMVAATAMLNKLKTDPQYINPETFNANRRLAYIRRNEEILNRYNTYDQDPFLDMELHVLRVGDVVFTTSSFELYLDYGLRIGARSSAAQTFQIQLACGSDGYLASERAVLRKMHSSETNKAVGWAHNYGASVGSSRVGPDGGQYLVNRTVELIGSLFPPEGQ